MATKKKTKGVDEYGNLFVDKRTVKEYSYDGCEDIIRVEFGPKVQFVDNWAFCDCPNLKEVVFGQNLEGTNGEAFLSCPRLEKFSIADDSKKFCCCDGVLYRRDREYDTSTGEWTEYPLYELVLFPKAKGGKFKIPDGVLKIGQSAFCENAVIEEVALGANVKWIIEWAFKGCSALKKITFNDGLDNIWPSAFENCAQLREVVMPGSLWKIDNAAFRGCTSLGKADLGAITGEFSLGYCAFEGCKSLKEVVLPQCLKKIDFKTFEGCDVLEKINMPASLKRIGEEAFAGCSALGHIELPANVVEVAENAFPDSRN